MLFIQIGTSENLIQQIIDMALNRSFLNEPLPKNQTEFQERLQSGKMKVSLLAQDITRQVTSALQQFYEAQKKLSQVKSISPNTHADIQQQINDLIYHDFVSKTPYEQLIHLPRYLKGIIVRIDKLRGGMQRDQENQQNLLQLKRQWQRIQQNLGAENILNKQKADEIRWLFEELRIALFAQELKTPVPISVKRIEKILTLFSRLKLMYE
jgi:ATP-dependent helicase HrpA